MPAALIMAAGHGTRMRSRTPKVLHEVCGRPMVEWVVRAARGAGADRVVAVVRPDTGVAERLPDGVEAAEQSEGEGTAAAVDAARDQLAGEDTILLLSGDHPLITSQLLTELLDAHREHGAQATMLTTEDLDPTAYGRIVRGPDGRVEQIVETKDESGVAPEHLEIREVNLGTYVFDGPALFAALARVEPGPSGERYLTAVFPLLEKVAAHATDDVTSAAGVNDRADLMAIEEVAQARIVEEHARAGVTFRSPGTVVIDAGVEIGEDTVVEAGVTLKGDTRIGSGVTLADAYVVDAEVHDGASVGPFAYLRPGTVIGERAKIGTFVETKNSDIGAGAKVPHLSYLGDADVGEDANVAAGNITANYDGFTKSRTKIGKRVKTGVNSSFIAPVTVGDDAYTGAGSVIGDDVPDGALGISRPEQKNVEGYAERAKRRKGS
ncbi:MAG TPA: bifunctional UDP-N-acetylglucosamine diphosphorylase/glucosamine-1-phosphate N-acetyltransferase GlmU [Thermoleophilaceae bacterium]|nr:bifunctional UDP-N-acetylglucosamine diphosphorylase/glucosamine-1-phosphate N-acetyltransferase GlmU [Thermoleophilaceae bacterium]